MKLLFLSLFMIVTIPMLSACQATARDDDGYVSVGTNDGYYNNDESYYNRGKFCPPGQAKKGNC